MIVGIVRHAFALALFLAGQWAWSACSVNADSVNFGSYDTLSSSDTDGVGTIAVNCDSGVPYSISLSPGGGSYSARAMTSGADVLNYNLYTSAARSVVWGNGVGMTGNIGGTGTGSNANFAVYGRIAARQNVRAGTYSDSIVVEVNF